MSISQQKVIYVASSKESPQQSFLKHVANQIQKNKPHFRYVEYDRLSRTQHIRVKFWKFHSCNPSKFSTELKLNQSDESLRTRTQRRNEFQNTVKHSIIKRSLKYTKKFEFSSKAASKDQFLIELCKSLKLEKFNLSVVSKKKSERLLKTFTSSKLKDCSLECSFDLHSKLIYPF